MVVRLTILGIVLLMLILSSGCSDHAENSISQNEVRGIFSDYRLTRSTSQEVAIDIPVDNFLESGICISVLYDEILFHDGSDAIAIFTPSVSALPVGVVNGIFVIPPGSRTTISYKLSAPSLDSIEMPIVGETGNTKEELAYIDDLKKKARNGNFSIKPMVAFFLCEAKPSRVLTLGPSISGDVLSLSKYMRYEEFVRRTFEIAIK